MADKVIGLTFGVAGGENGASATNIVKTLNAILAKVDTNLKINVDKKYFEAQLKDALSSANKQIEGLSAKLKKVTGQSSKSSGSSKSTSKSSSSSGSSTSSGGGTFKQETQEVNSLATAIESLTPLLVDYYNAYSRLGNAKKTSSNLHKEELAHYEELKWKLLEAEKALSQYTGVENTNISMLDMETRGSAEYNAAITKLRDSMDIWRTAQARVQDQSAKLEEGYTRETSKAQDLIKRYKDLAKYAPEAVDQIKKLQDLINKDTSTMTQQQLGEYVNNLGNEARRASKELARIDRETGGIGRSIAEAFDSRIVNLFAFALGSLVENALSQVYENVVALDSAITDLQIATGKTREETSKLIKEYAGLADQLGATITEVAEGADTWLRQGYDAEEANELIYASTMLSKLGQLEAAEASKALTSALKGYKLEVEDATAVVDKFTAVDMEAAISAGDIATAMAETAAGADLAGLSMDRLIGYIATVGEVTQDAPESVGTFFRSMLARMQNVAAGKFVDDETGENLNNVETVLTELGIALRDQEGNFRNMGDVLDEIGLKWDSFENKEQHAIATAVAGVRAQEKFIVLMSNYGTALNYAATAADSLGTASSKFDDAYLESIEAATNRLTSAWQEFSYEVLDSDFVKQVLQWITELIKGLTNLAERIDLLGAILPTLGAIIFQVFGNKMAAALKSIKGFQSGLGIIITIVGLLSSIFGNMEKGVAQAVLSITSGIAAIVTAIIGAAKLAQAGLNKIPIVAVISAVLSGIMAVASAIDTLYESAEEKAEAAKQAAEDARQAAEEEGEQTKEIVELYREYKNITSEINDMNAMTEEQKENLLNLQKQIAEAVGGEVEGLDLVNGKLEENIKLLKQKIAAQSGEQYSSALSSIIAAQEAYDSAYESTHAGIGGIGPETWKYDNTFEAGFDAGPDAGKIVGIMDEVFKKHGVNVWTGLDTNIGDLYYFLKYLDDDLDPELLATIWREIAEEVELQGLAPDNLDIYNQIIDVAERFEEYPQALANAANEFLGAATNKYGFGAGIEQIVSQEEYDSAFNIIYDIMMEDLNVLEMIEKGAIEADDVKKAVENWLKTWYDLSFDSDGNLEETTLSFADFGSSFRDSFEMLQKALDSFNEHGIVTAEIIEEIIEKYPELMKYFKLTEDGYIPAVGPDDLYANYTDIDLLYDWGAHFLQKYVDNLAACTEGTEEWTKANEELSLAMAYVATLIRDEIVEEETEKLEEKQEALEKQLEQYRALIEERKELLNTYKEEIDYQKELEEKQDNVANLQTQLAVARLDTSAAGQARVRELEEELAEAQEELDDFTLEHAIEVLTEQLDTSLEDYEDFIEEQVDRIETAIQNLKFTVNVNPVVPEPSEPEEDEGDEGADTDVEIKPDDDGSGGATKPPRWTSYADAQASGYGSMVMPEDTFNRRGGQVSGGQKYSSYQQYLDDMYDYFIEGKKYHSGGFVGGLSTLKSNEQFAKLLKGEFVSTPAQMDKFMKETFPSMVSMTNKGGTTYNAPLVSIECGSITQETLPQVESAIKAAVAEIKTQIDSGISRTGYRRPVNKFSR